MESAIIKKYLRVMYADSGAIKDDIAGWMAPDHRSFSSQEMYVQDFPVACNHQLIDRFAPEWAAVWRDALTRFTLREFMRQLEFFHCFFNAGFCYALGSGLGSFFKRLYGGSLDLGGNPT